MKTLIITMSPRKSFSASMYYSKVLKTFMKKGTCEILELKTNKQYNEIIVKLSEVDNVVFVTPVYVDTIPSTVLEKLVKIENYVKENPIKLNVYTITNCGFYEGTQCKLANKTFKLWCKKCGFNYKGGMSIGAGVMVAFIRTLIPIGIGITLCEYLLFTIISIINNGVINIGEVIHFPVTLVVHIILYILWSMGLFINSFKMSKKVSKNKNMDNIYTGLWFCPRFMFVIIASIYWILASIFWYKGKFWNMLKEPK